MLKTKNPQLFQVKDFCGENGNPLEHLEGILAVVKGILINKGKII